MDATGAMERAELALVTTYEGNEDNARTHEDMAGC